MNALDLKKFRELLKQSLEDIRNSLNCFDIDDRHRTVRVLKKQEPLLRQLEPLATKLGLQIPFYIKNYRQPTNSAIGTPISEFVDFLLTPEDEIVRYFNVADPYSPSGKAVSYKFQSRWTITAGDWGRIAEDIERWLTWVDSELQTAGEVKAAKKPTVNSRMLDEFQRTPTSGSWTVRDWASHLDCSTTAVYKTVAWKHVMELRGEEKLSRKECDNSRDETGKLRVNR